MDENLKAEYDEVISRLLWKKGSFVSKDESYFSWVDWELSSWNGAHNLVCAMGEHSIPKEVTWHEFMGTFYEGDTSVHGMEMAASCKCGVVKDRKIRVQMNIGEAIREMFEVMVEYQRMKEESSGAMG